MSQLNQQSTIFSRQSSWLAPGGAIAVARGGDAALRFALFLATARILGARDFSLYALLTAALATCQWMVPLGGVRVALYFHARGVRGPLFAWLYLVAALGSAAVFAAAAFPGLRHSLFPEVSTALLFLGLAPLPFSLAADSLAATLLSTGRTGIYGATLWARNAATGLVLATSLLAPDRLTWILAGRLVVQASIAAVTAIAARGLPRWKAVPDFAPGALRYAVPTALSDAANAVHRRADVFLLSALGRTPEIAPYAIAYAIAEVFWLLTDSLETALFVDITRRDPAEARASASKALRLYLLLGLAAGAAGLLAGEALLRLFFHALAPSAAGLLPWLVGAAVAWGLSRPLSSFFASRQRLGTILSCHLAALAINVALNLLWIPRAGATGAAQACLVSYAADSLFLMLAFRFREHDEGREGTSPSAPAS